MAENNSTVDSDGSDHGPIEDRVNSGGEGVPQNDYVSGIYLDRYNQGRNVPKNVGEPVDDGTYYGIHPPPAKHVAAGSQPAPVPTRPTPPVVAPHVNTPAQNAALHKHTAPGDN